MDADIHELCAEAFAQSVAIIRASFQTVADSLGITEESTPTHSAFTKEVRLHAKHAGGTRMFGLYEDGKQAGYVELEPKDATTAILGKLAVLPECRHKGYGAQLVNKVIDEASRSGYEVLEISLVEQNTVLKQWYISLGFTQTGVKHVPSLPFDICFMQRTLS